MRASIELRSHQICSRPVVERDSIEQVVCPYQGPYLGVKAVLDAFGALILLILLSPTMLVAGLAVKLTSSGPVFYRQPRQGRGGKVFKVWKFRTMIDNAEAGLGAVWSSVGDPRITPIGRFLRETHVDEFPQLFNVLAGSMSLVGPRPERPEIASELAYRIPGYALRLALRPGITGFAQVRLPPDTDLAGVRRKLAHDLYYIQHAGLLMDLKILLRTAINFVWSVGDVTVTTARLPKAEVVDKLMPYLLDDVAAKDTFKESEIRTADAARSHEKHRHEVSLAAQ